MKIIKFFEERKKISIIITILIAIAIFLFSSIPDHEGKVAPGTTLLSIIYHFSIFFLLNFFLLISLHENKKLNPKYILFSILISIIYGILDEFHQMFVPFRFPSLNDVLVNSIGTLSSCLVYVIRKK